jgi:two-component system chemotaxis sensor kinase CheA
MVWVESGDKSYCLFVDDLLGEQQVVVKPLPVYLNSFNIKDSGISGCTILGDGNISIILDVLNLYAAAHNQY